MNKTNRPLPNAPMPDEKWAAKAECRVTIGIAFHPQHGQPRRFWDQAAKAVCATCPVREPCLQHGLRWHEAGVWGGTNESERRRMRTTRVDK
jgi:WhiB family redox-sensing transcriptional regulator